MAVDQRPESKKPSTGTQRRHASEHDVSRKNVESRLRSVVFRSRLAILWEDLWRASYQPLIVIALFFGVSWMGLWLLLPSWGRVVGVLLFLLALLWSLRDLRHVRWPDRDAGIRRVELSSGHSHRPLTTLEDEIGAGTNDPIARALWLKHKQRIAEALKAMKAGGPRPDAWRRDPYALRVVALAFLIVGYASSGDGRWSRVAAAFQPDQDQTDIASRLDAWITPPVYTSRPPVFLTGESGALRDEGAPVRVPEGSIMVIRSQGQAALTVVHTAGGNSSEIPTLENSTPDSSLPSEHQLTLMEDGSVVVREGETEIKRWAFRVDPDEDPVIRLNNDPEEQLSGALKFSYLVRDDYGVTYAASEISPAPGTGAQTKDPRPLVDAPNFPLSLPPRSSTSKLGETIKDLTSHPWAGSEVDLVLVARDEAGQEGRSDAYRFVLPQRRFAKPLARAVVEQRRNLALDAKSLPEILVSFDTLMMAPAVFEVDPKIHLGMRFAYGQLAAAHTDEALRELLPLLWDLALTIEDGDLSLAERALRQAQEALRKALEDGASDEEIAKLTEQLRQALNEYMQALAEQMRRNPQAMQQFNPNQQTMNQQDLDEMLRKIEELAKTGSRDAARELLAQMQRMLENLQAGRPQMSPDGLTNEMMQMLNELSEMIQRQQDLMDQTHRFNRDQQQQQRGQRGGEQGQNQMTPEQLAEALKQLQQGQGDLAQKLQQLMEQLGQNGLPENSDLGQAGESMGDAQQSLGEGQGDQAVGQQGDALDALRRGAQGLSEQMMGEGEGPGMAGGRSPLDEDPLGRPRRTEGPDFGNRVKVPDEIDVQRARRILEELRRRFSDPARPQLELDYLERLLKRY